MEKLYSRETELEAELAIALDKLEVQSDPLSQEEISERRKIILKEKSMQGEKYEQEIKILQRKIKSLEEFEDEDAEFSLKSRLNEKNFEIEDLKEKIKVLEEELELEKEQRQNATILLAQMGKDMKVLLKAAKDS